MSGIRRLLALQMAAVSALLATSCGESASAPSTHLDEVRDMLRHRADRLAMGDTAGYLAPVAEPARALEKTIADGSRRVPLASVALLDEAQRSIDPDAPSFPGLVVQFVYRYRDIPSDNTFSFRLVYDIEKRNGSWVVAGSSPLPPTPQQAQLPIWASGPVAVSQTAHFLVLYRPGLAHLEDSLALAEQAYGNLRPRLNFERDPRYVMLLAGDDNDLRAMAGAGVPTGVLGLAEHDFVDTGIPVGRDLIIKTSSVFGATPIALHTDQAETQLSLAPVAVFQHELGHLAMSRFDQPTTPSWVAEAAAMYLSGEQRLPQWRAGMASGYFDRVSFAALDLPGARLSGRDYPFVDGAVLHLVRAFGEARFYEFYRAFKTVADNPYLSPEERAVPAKTLLREIYGYTEDELDTHTRRYIADAVAAAEGAGSH